MEGRVVAPMISPEVHVAISPPFYRFGFITIGCINLTGCTPTIADPGYSVVADVQIDIDSLDEAYIPSEVVIEVISSWDDVRTPVRIGKICDLSSPAAHLWSFVDLGSPSEATIVALVSPLIDDCVALEDTGQPTRETFPDELPRSSIIVFEGQSSSDTSPEKSEENVILSIP